MDNNAFENRMRELEYLTNRSIIYRIAFVEPVVRLNQLETVVLQKLEQQVVG